MLDLKFLGSVLWRGRLAFSIAFIALVAGAVLLIRSRPPQFSAELLIEADTKPLRSTLNLGSDQTVNAARVEPTVLVSAVNVLSSRSLMERVVVATRLDSDQEFASTSVPF